jgi:hypothetical protein
MATSDGIAQIEKGMWQWGRVTNVISPTQFQAPRLAEYGDGYFAFWTVFVLRDIRSTPTVIAAPQGEQQIASAFTSLGGVMTHPAFTAPMVVGDEILMIHPNIGAGIGAAIVAILVGLAALQADVGNASASALGSLYGILGDPATDLATSIATLLARLTAARAGYLDNLIGIVATGVYGHPNGVAPQDALIFAAANQEINLRFDMNGLAQNTTVREYEQVDGVNYQEISAKVFPTDFDPGCKVVALRFVQANALYKVTFQSAVAEGAPVNVPYRYITKDLS